MKLLLVPLLLLCGASAASAQIETVYGEDVISASRAKINNNFSFLANSKAARWSGSGVPGSIALSLQGDLYLDLTNSNVYQCFAAAATPCTAVGAGNWIRINGAAAASCPANQVAIGTTIAGVTCITLDLTTAYFSGILPGAKGGTGNGFWQIAGPAGTTKTHTWPNSSIDFTALTGVGKWVVGVPSVVPGSATDCVKVNGTSGACNAALTSSDLTITIVGPDIVVNPSLVVTPSGSNDLSGGNLVNVATLSGSMTNAAVTGTTVNRLMIQTAGTAVIAGTGTVSGILGVVMSGAGTAGTARYAFAGSAICDFDGAITTNHYVIESVTTGGKCHDSGTALTSAPPTGSQIVGYTISTQGGAGAYSMIVTTATYTSGAGSGASYSRGVYASAPACSTSQSIYNATDAALTAYCDGSSNQDWKYKGVTVTPTVVGDLGTWFNQGGAAVTSYPGSWLLTGTTGAGEAWRGRYKTAPATPFSVVTCLEGLSATSNFGGFGMFWTDATKLITAALQNSAAGAGGVMSINKFTNATTFSATYVNSVTSATPTGMFCLALTDDGTNRKEKFSYDGVNWTTLHSVGRTDFLTATGVGVVVDDAAGTIPPQVQVVSVVTLASAL